MIIYGVHVLLVHPCVLTSHARAKKGQACCFRSQMQNQHFTDEDMIKTKGTLFAKFRLSRILFEYSFSTLAVTTLEEKGLKHNMFQNMFPHVTCNYTFPPEGSPNPQILHSAALVCCHVM